ncbi:MAG: CinA family protein [Rhodocyclaceae bacterium]|nr:CinA family protein [Rhodocyclaceae bacterium]
MTSDDISVRARTLATLLTRRGQRLATAESCTGGLIAGTLTALPGSSNWFERGWVTYSNAAKTEELGVDDRLIAKHGAVSESVASAMASGARAAARVDFALSVTGIAGPDGGSAEKPVGTVCFGWATPTQTMTETWHFSGDRQRVREQSVAQSLAGLIALLMDDTV